MIKHNNFISSKNEVSNNRSNGGVFFNIKKCNLYLSDGTEFSGMAPAWQTAHAVGEVVFNTGMTGYTESLTDPSYAGQILVFSYPLIGNYGVDIKTMESDKVQVAGVIVSNLENNWSHVKSNLSLLDWLKDQNIPVTFGVDTRALTKHLRTSGTMMGAIANKPNNFKDIKNITNFVSINKPKVYNKGASKKVVLVDCGTKENIVRKLTSFKNVEVIRVPFNYDYSAINYDGVFVSNGPGNPEDYHATIKNLQVALAGDKPVYGICLGSQLVALACGAKTYKLKFGHRGHNQPCIALDNNCYITSQNHGYAVDEASLPKNWQVIFRNLNDNSVEGVAHKTKPFYTVQFHPEASPGPTDTAFIFERFVGLL
jgi:carbamoyl-phosphate synthase small subunit